MNFEILNTTSQNLIFWGLFGYIVSHIDCNIQEKLKEYPLIGYILLFFCCFFLFVSPIHSLPYIVDNPSRTLSESFINTIIVFLIFILFIKSFWLFSLLSIIVIIVYQLLKVLFNLKLENTDNTKEKNEIKKSINLFSKINFVLIVTLLLIGVFFNIYILNKKNRNFKTSFFRLFKCS